jgi:BirA family transcriptional regulator, biotin operon repressor / biotin---[acetyl-CoA-carboxylase] ligase
MRVHYRQTDSTNDRARELAARGAPHLTLVTAREQSAGRGRQGRTWVAPPGAALLMSLVLRAYDELAPLRAGVAVSDVAGPAARVKWPNDVLLDGRKLSGILMEGRPQEGWVVLGIGVNVSAAPPQLPAAALDRGDPEQVLEEILGALRERLAQPREQVLAALRERDALLGRHVSWHDGSGTGAGISDDGCLRVRRDDGGVLELRSGEVHLDTPPAP